MRRRTVDRRSHSRDSVAPLVLGVLIASLSLTLSGSLATFFYPGDFPSELHGSKVTLYRAHLLANIGATRPQMSAQTKTRPKHLSTCFGGPPLERVGHSFTTLWHFSSIHLDIGSFLFISLPLDRAPPHLC